MGRGHRDPRRVECTRSGGSAWSAARARILTAADVCDGDVTIIRAAIRGIAAESSPSGTFDAQPSTLAMTAAVAAQRQACSRAFVFALSAAPAASATAADPAKVLRVVFSIAETSFDPQFASDAASDCDHREHLRGDARLRLSRAPGAARAADARSDADGAGQRSDLRFPA